MLTETLVTFLTALAILVLLETDLGISRNAANALVPEKRALSPWFFGGIVVGFGALVRPETPLLLLAGGLVLLARWWRSADWLKLARAGALMGLGLLLPLLPWAARNWHTLHEVQFIAPRYSAVPGDFAPVGFNAWTRTWLWRYGDVYLTLWKLNVEEIPITTVPVQCVRFPNEQARVADLLKVYNDNLTLSPEQDRAFGELAAERTARDPLRTHFTIPELLRSLAMWFTPRVERFCLIPGTCSLSGTNGKMIAGTLFPP